MKKLIQIINLLLILNLLNLKGYSQEIISEKFKAQKLKEYKAFKNPEITYDFFLDMEVQKIKQAIFLKNNPNLSYAARTVTLNSPCGNGDFEAGLLSSEWSGAGGYGVNINGTINYAGMIPGLTGGPIYNSGSHQTLETAGVDPNVPINTVAPGGSTKSVRIGNSFNGGGAEYLSKSFIVTATNANISFWYALVLQNPIGHAASAQPSFKVRVIDNSNNNEITGVTNLGNGSNELIADKNNPFFQNTVVSNEPVVYKDWSCAQINLSNHIGKSITIEFTTKDCSAGGHYGYAYIDNYCGTCNTLNPTGSIQINDTTTSKCGTGNICFNYSLPKSGTQTGSIQIILKIYQSGFLLSTLTSPVLTSGSTYCFTNINPATIPGISPAFGGFDFVGTGIFNIGTTSLAPLNSGALPDGQKAGLNNDYLIACPSPPALSNIVSSNCGTGTICANYTLGTLGVQTAGMVLTLKIFQNGTQVAQLASPGLTTGNQYCFNINPLSIQGLNLSLTGFDYTLTGVSSALSGFTFPVITIGTAPSGQVTGNNNDYNIYCTKPGKLVYNDSSTYKCGPGNICFKYLLPVAGAQFGALDSIALKIYQNGILLTTISNTGFIVIPGDSTGTYCFPINPLTLPGVNTNLPGIDFAAIAVFSFGGIKQTPDTVGKIPSGQFTGMNNDYALYCPRPGTITFDSSSSNCGLGTICYQYTLPASGFITGNVVLSLKIYQNGALITTLNSPLLTSGSKYCFNINPANFLGINSSLGGFDYIVTGNYTINIPGVTIDPITIGTVPNGRITGVNNDYKINCPIPGTLNYSPVNHCGTGSICFNYTLPIDGAQFGTGILSLNIIQNGVFITTLQSPEISNGNSYCFFINPDSIFAFSLIPPQAGFDFIATMSYSLNGQVSYAVVGTNPDGVSEGLNNDYTIKCPKSGNISLLSQQTSNCGRGVICFKYKLPEAGLDTGTVSISLNIYQNGSLLTTINSAQLNSDSVFCFNIDPTTIPGINFNTSGFDFNAIANYAVGAVNFTPDTLGNATNGQISGANNDYFIYCATTGTFSFTDSAKCGKDVICFNYTLPKAGPQTGTVQISMNVYQNGTFITTVSSPVLNNGTKYCFNPSIAGLDLNAGGFDFTGTAVFALGAQSFEPAILGDTVNGMFTGQNNDFFIYCTQTGSIYYNDTATTDCGVGNICFDYVLPKSGQTTGTVTINLKLYQNGILLTTITSPVLSSGNNYCFPINPATIPGIFASLTGFDFTATASFTLPGSVLAPITAGAVPNGQLSGLNNDYAIYCSKQCCPGTNLIVNGGFELGNTGFISTYVFEPTAATNSVIPGKYSILSSAEALTVSPNWNPDCAANNKHLIVNGSTGKTVSKVVWSQTVTLTRGETYTFCADFKNLNQCTFNVLPKVSVKFSSAATANVTNLVINAGNNGCNWQTVSKTFTLTGTGTVSTLITITLDELGIGDGNDIAIDNISLVNLPKVPIDQLLFHLNFFNVTSTSFSVNATPVNPLPVGCTPFWQVEELTTTFVGILSTRVINPPVWLPLSPNNFIGYNGTSILSGNNPGVFNIKKRYRIIYGRTCDCSLKNIYAIIMDPLVVAKNGKKTIRFYEDKTYTKHIIDTLLNSTEEKSEEVKNDKIIEPPIINEPTQLKLFPNPTSNKLNIILPSMKTENYLKLFNSFNQLLSTVIIKPYQTTTQLQLGKYPNGNYVVQFITPKGKIIFSDKVVKR